MKQKAKKTILDICLLVGIACSGTVAVKMCQHLNHKDRERWEKNKQEFKDNCIESGGRIIENSDGTIGCLPHENL